MGKKLLSLIILLISISIMIYSCGSSDSTKINTSEVALSEYSFKDDANLYAQFSHVTVVDFEHSNATNVNEKDSGGIGADVIPFLVRGVQDITLEFDDIGNGNHFAILRDENEEEVARIDANGTPVTVQLFAGKYKLYLHNMGNETFPLFLRPITADIGSNRQASFNPLQLAKFLFTHSCAGCDLSYALLQLLPLSHADLEGANLSNAILAGANLSHANLSFAVLSGALLNNADLSRADLSNAGLSLATLHFADLAVANLTNANLTKANLHYANLTEANLTNANLTKANLHYANLNGANLTKANLFNANLNHANLNGANLTNANLYGAWFLDAIWIDGRTCVEPSIGRCD